MQAALPPTFISGGSLEAQSDKYRLGEYSETDSDINVQQVNVRFDPNVLPDMLGVVKGIAQEVLRISPAGVGQEFSSRTSATEASALMAQQAQAEN